MSDQAAPNQSHSNTSIPDNANDAAPEPTPYWGAAVPPRRRRTWLYWLIGLGSVVVGGFIALFVIGMIIGAGEVAEQHPARLEKPIALAGLELSTEPQLQAIAERAAGEFVAGGYADADEVMVTHYEDPTSPDKLVLLHGATVRLSEPEVELDAVFDGFPREGLPMRREIEIDPGSMGGFVRCGKSELNGAQVSLCAWADHGSLMVGMFFNRGIEESSELLLEIREQILVRSE